MQKKNIFLIVLLFALACTNEDKKVVVEQSNDTYLEYTISGEEDLNFVTCLVHFFEDGSKRESFELEPPSTITLDGEALVADSTEYTGTYYEIMKPLESFSGQHTLLFADGDKEQHKETFAYTPFKLSNTLNEQIGKKDLLLEIEGLKNGDVVRTILLDASFDSNGIDEKDTVTNNKIIIPLKKLQTLENGPVMLQLIKEEERDLTNGFKKVGHILITYSLKRELELKK